MVRLLSFLANRANALEFQNALPPIFNSLTRHWVYPPHLDLKT
jgi:hypothetical protein